MSNENWSCLGCTFTNNLKDLKCTMCNEPNLESWTCSACTLLNISRASRCAMCGKPNPAPLNTPSPTSTLPADVKTWTKANLKQWLTQERLEEFIPEFERAEVDGKTLLLLKEEDLERDVHITRVLPRRQILTFIQKNQPVALPITPPPRDETETKDWSCLNCTKKNKESDKSCTACKQPKEKDEKESKPWNCKCRKKNLESVSRCTACGSPKEETRLTPYVVDDYLPWGARNRNTDHDDAVPLLICDRNGKMLLDQKTAKESVFLNYSDPLVIVTFTGIPGQGKSTTASNFHNFAFNTTKELFRTSVGVRTFTKGAWIGKRPLIFKNSSQQMMLMDLEGLQQRDECYHLQIAGMIFSDTVCYMNTGQRIDDNLIRMLNAIIGLKEELKMAFEYPKIVFVMINSTHASLENKFQTDDLERGGSKTVTHDEYRQIFLQDYPILQRAFGADKIYFRTLSRPSKNIPRSSLSLWESKSDLYYREMADLVQLCSIPTLNKMKGVDRKVQLLATVVATLNSSRRIEVVNILKNIFVREITEQSSLLLLGKKSKLQRQIAEDYENKNVSPRVSLSLYYPTIKNEYDVAMRQFAIGLGLIDEKTREDELKRLPFVREDSFYEFCESSMNARRLREQEERQKMIEIALTNKQKVLPKMNGRTKCSNGCVMNLEKIVDVNCKNGQDGTWYWIRRGSAEKICNNCHRTSTFTATVCTGCGGHVSDEVWNEYT